MSKILIDEATVTKALEALVAANSDEHRELVFEYREGVITTLIEALAEQPAQHEPVAVISAEQLSGMFHKIDGLDQNQWGYHWKKGWNAALRQAMDYTSPQAQPAHKPLTDEQIIDIRRRTTAKQHGAWADTKAFARAIEAAHNIKP